MVKTAKKKYLFGLNDKTGRNVASSFNLGLEVAA